MLGDWRDQNMLGLNGIQQRAHLTKLYGHGLASGFTSHLQVYVNLWIRHYHWQPQGYI